MTEPTLHRWATLVAIALSVAACTPHAQTAELSTPQQNVRMPDNPDAFDHEMVRQLVAAGADVSKPARVLYSLYIPSRRDADAAGRELLAAGYRATVQRPAGKLPDGSTETRWWLVATNTATPTLDHARRVRQYFDALARRYRGEYSGWGANIVK